MKVAKLSNGRIVELLLHDVPVLFDPSPGWSLIAYPLNASVMRQNLTWVQSTTIVWSLDFGADTTTL